mmetsp:Transcript_19561/g.47778  ORF Transcript_19561/g.47778 Transcript_19561/m.47778 type:complete len:349 (-) Transcript_19561:327-1373(-)|eukprot:CAMPEP_0114516360 /NCGR_PEP_ID=MMETSP0109-20121206/17284_1 /TAXON_ID=29199 /ORGANISM="Chlorarachnion reptans, Strain CCCM449" /LENGTH=348 /DNA_ID=CAMNT_0001696739 /DNA_START=70 /DNA_END=1116 /DNA_ORIENTATION=-
MSAPVLLGVGNPLLDISADADMEMVKKYELKMSNAILAEEKHMPIYGELQKAKSVKYIAGGATQNSIRVAQWMMQKEGSTAFIGCVGKDDYAKKLTECAEGDGVKVMYLEDADTPTGTCACLIVDKERSLVANLAAANKYKIDHMKSEPIVPIYTGVSMVYIAGFFLTVSPETIMLLAEHCSDKGKTFCMNLSAPFIMMFFSEPLKKALPYMDFLFGNEGEAAEFGKMMKYEETDVAKIAALASKEESVKGKKRTVVFTQGSNCTCVAVDGKVTKYVVPKLDAKKIVDVNGAGDAFVGGFLSQLSEKKDIPTCVDAGHYAAQVIIQSSGTNLSGKPSYEPKKAEIVQE